MIRFALIDPGTGTIVQTGTGPNADHMALQARITGLQAEEIADPAVTDATHYWTGDGFAAYPPRPGPWARWDRTRREWTDPRTDEDRAADLARRKDAAIAGVNAIRGDTRMRFATETALQSLVYGEKLRQAKAWVAARAAAAAGTAPAPRLGDYRAIAAEVGTTAPAADAVAQVFLNGADIMNEVFSLIEQCVMEAITDIERAETVEAVNAAADLFPPMLVSTLELAGFR